MTLRLDRFLSENTAYSRKELKQMISKGRVLVNASVVKSPDTRITDTDEVLLDGQKVTAVGFVYLLLNKPQGVVSATEDRERTVIDLVKADEEFKPLAEVTELFPVGRLDKDTEGLLILTNDGDFAHEVLSPNRHVPKTYYAECEGTLSDTAVAEFKNGIPVGEEYIAKPAGLEILFDDHKSCKLKVTLTEGRFHQVKRMCHEVGVEVTFLKRISFGRLELPSELPVGSIMRVSKEDII